MSLVNGVAGSVAGGALGALVWAGVSYATDYEVGWIAWGIGALAGYGMVLGLKGACDQTSGIVAALIAFAAVFAGKYMAVHFAVQKSLAEVAAEPIDDHWLQVRLADEVVAEWEGEGKTLEWPPGMTLEQAEKAADYPAGIWDEAETRFNAMSPAERDGQRTAMVQERDEALRLAQSTIAAEGFTESLGPHDLLWSVLAVVTAFKLASRSKSTSETPEAPVPPAPPT